MSTQQNNTAAQSCGSQGSGLWELHTSRWVSETPTGLLFTQLAMKGVLFQSSVQVNEDGERRPPPKTVEDRSGPCGCERLTAVGCLPLRSWSVPRCLPGLVGRWRSPSVVRGASGETRTQTVIELQQAFMLWTNKQTNKHTAAILHNYNIKETL